MDQTAVDRRRESRDERRLRSDDADVPRRRISTGHEDPQRRSDRKSTRLNSSHVEISYAVFCLKKKTTSRLSTGARAPSCATLPALGWHRNNGSATDNPFLSVRRNAAGIHRLSLHGALPI